MATITIPAETHQMFKEHAEAAVQAFREALNLSQYDRGAIIAAFENIFLPSLKEHFLYLAQEEFDRIGKEYVRGVVLGVFDKFVEQSR